MSWRRALGTVVGGLLVPGPIGMALGAKIAGDTQRRPSSNRTGTGLGRIAGQYQRSSRTTSSAPRRPTSRGPFSSWLGGMQNRVRQAQRSAALEQALRAREQSAFLGNFDRSLTERRAALQGQLAGEQGWLARERAALSGRFNFGEDPRARAARDAAINSLNRQRDDAARAIDASFGAGINASRQAAADSLALGKRSGEELGSIYSSAANAVASANNQLAQQAQAGAGFLGVQGPVGGEAVDVGAALAAAAPREQALAQTLGQIGSDMQGYFASSMANQQGAEQGSMRRAVTAMQDQVNRDFMEREAARIQAEREAFRAAEMDLAGRARDRMSAIQQALADLAGQGSQARAEWAMRDADRRYEQSLTRDERAFAVREARRQEAAARRSQQAEMAMQMQMLGASRGGGGATSSRQQQILRELRAAGFL